MQLLTDKLESLSKNLILSFITKNIPKSINKYQEKWSLANNFHLQKKNSEKSQLILIEIRLQNLLFDIL